MDRYYNELHCKFDFINKTICHAARACRTDARVPRDLRRCVYQLSRQSGKAKRRLHAEDVSVIRQTVEALACLSERAQSAIRPADDINYDVRSAVILTHIEVSALRLQLDQAL